VLEVVAPSIEPELAVGPRGAPGPAFALEAGAPRGGIEANGSEVAGGGKGQRGQGWRKRARPSCRMHRLMKGQIWKREPEQGGAGDRA